MNISTKADKATAPSGLNIWGGVVNNENPRATKGFGGKTPGDHGQDLSNEQPVPGKPSGFKGFTPNRKNIDYSLGGDKSSNENPRGWKQ